MKISDLSLREKVLQTLIVRVDNETFYPEKVGGFFPLSPEKHKKIAVVPVARYEPFLMLDLL